MKRKEVTSATVPRGQKCFALYWRCKIRVAVAMGADVEHVVAREKTHTMYWRIFGTVSPMHRWIFGDVSGKWNESGFRPLLYTNRQNWAMKTSWWWWDEWDNTALQKQDLKCKPWRSQAEHATFRLVLRVDGEETFSRLSNRRNWETNPERREKQRC